ncbi:MAG: hypothetical protein JKX74_01465, partial [Flavobacteriales bacterium]|nr:hypothetical protein [Flavobacteriales bacterium]
IDPTVTIPGNYGGWQNASINPGSAEANPTIFVFTGIFSGDIYRAYTKFNTASIPDNAMITDVQVQLDMNQSADATAQTIVINDVTGAPGPYVVINPAAYNDFNDGPYTSFTCTSVGTYGFFDLGFSADTNLQNRLAVDWFQIALENNLGTFKRFTSDLNFLSVTYDTCVMTSTIITNASCAGTNDGGITIVIDSLGTPPFTYLWNTTPPQTDSAAIGLDVGIYTVTITDAAGCITTRTAEVVQSHQASIIDSVDILCKGDSTGLAEAMGSGGTPPYIFIWDDPNLQTTAIATGLPEGVYTVYVSDAIGCIDSAYVTLEALFQAGITDSTSTLCNGDSTGTATVTPFFGTGPYTYAWNSIPPQSDSIAIGLPAGGYKVLVTDGNGCTDTPTVTIPEPPLLVLSPLSSNTCGISCTGAATVFPSGGTLPYTYAWSDPAAQTTQTATGLCAGAVDVLVTDNNGCDASLIFIIISDTPPLAGFIVNDTLQCVNLNTFVFTNSGSSGNFMGTPLFSYIWDFGDGIGTSTAENPIYSYSSSFTFGVQLVVTDVFNGCTDTAWGDVYVAPIADIEVLPTSCGGNCDGGAVVTVTGESPPYTYLWNDGSATTTDSVANLCIGLYRVAVTDGGGCTDTVQVFVFDPPPITTSVFPGPPSCFSCCDGSATVSVTGGTPPYSYIWDDPGAQTNATATGLCEGIYFVSVIDSGGCFLSIDSVLVTIYCIPPYDILCSSNDYIDDVIFAGINNLATGCNGMPDNFIYYSNDTASVLSGSSYPITLTPSTVFAQGFGVWIDFNSNGDYSDPGEFVLSIPPSLVSSTNFISIPFGSPSGVTRMRVRCIYLITPISADDCNLQTWGETEDYPIVISSPLVLDAAVIGMAPEIDSSCQLSNSELFTVMVYNNGNDSLVNIDVSYVFDLNPSITEVISGILLPGDTAFYTFTSLLDLSDTGMHSLMIYTTVTGDVNLFNDTIFRDIYIRPPPDISINSSDISCFGSIDGQAVVLIANGASPFQILWSPGGSTNDTATGLGPGLHYVTVTDSNGCFTSDSAQIIEPTLLTTTMTSTDATCTGCLDGTATVLPGGGTPPYSYLWSTGDTTSVDSGLMAGSYYVTVTDSNGCVAVDSILLQELTGQCLSCDNTVPTLILDLTSTADTILTVSSFARAGYCCGVSGINKCIRFEITPHPQTRQVSFNVMNPSPPGSAFYQVNCGSPIPLTNFTCLLDTLPFCIVFCKSGNDAPDYIITTSSVSCCNIVAAVTGNDISCNGNSDGTASVSITGGTSPFTFLWSNGDNGSTADSLSGGTHFVTITDVNGCTNIDSAIISEPGVLTANAGLNDTLCVGQSVVIGGSPTSVGGIGPYTYSWSPGTGLSSISIANPIATPPFPVTYTVQVTDSNGCVATDLASINTNPSYSINDPAVSICVGDSALIYGVYQTIAAIYYDSSLTIVGCDSIRSQQLTVDSAYSILDTVTICSNDSVFLAGAYQTVAGNYIDNLSTLQGCDSIVATTLIVNLSFSVNVSTTICSNDSIFLEGAYQNTSGPYFDTLVAVNGCDSLVSTLLSVNQAYLIPVSATICAGDSLLISGVYQSLAGVYNDSLASIDGCDSVISTTLIV